MISTLLRTAVIYVCVIIAIRLMGKRQISDMQPTELVITLLISEIAAIPLQDSSKPIFSGIVAIFMLVVLEILLSFLAMKSQFTRKLAYGKAVVIINNGVIDQQAMRKVRMTVPDLMEQLRSKDYFDINQIAYAILEVNGELNVMPKDAFTPAVKGDVTKSISAASIPLAVICDGAISDEAVNILGLTNDRIFSKLKSMDLKLEQVFLMTEDSRGNSTIVLREEGKK